MGNFCLSDKDISLTIVLFITILQNKQKAY